MLAYNDKASIYYVPTYKAWFAGTWHFLFVCLTTNNSVLYQLYDEDFLFTHEL